MRCHCLRIFGAIIRKVIGAIRHPTSDIGRPTFEIRHPTSHIWHPRFDIRHPTSEIRHPTSDIRDLTSDIRHPTSEIRHLTSEIWHPRSEIRRLTFERMAVMCSAWDEGTYEVRFERKQCRLFCFFFFNIFIILHCSECLLPQYAPSLGNVQRSRILFRSVRWI